MPQKFDIKSLTLAKDAWAIDQLCREAGKRQRPDISVRHKGSQKMGESKVGTKMETLRKGKYF